MIDTLAGTITHIHQQAITLSLGGIGFAVQTPKPAQMTTGKLITLFTYLHWNQESGPSLYGFQSELERTIFLLIIDCPKIGPKIGLAVLAGLTAPQVIDIATSQDEKTLSSISGIGPKKAEQIIAHLKHKVAKLLSTGKIAIEESQGGAGWHKLSEALASLGYSKQEVQSTLTALGGQGAEQRSFDQLLRSALAHLSRGW